MNDDLLEKLLRSKKYRDVCPDTVRRVWSACAARHKKPKDAEKAAREALHGITGAFMTPGEADRLARDMRAWRDDRTDSGLEAMLSRHTSARERLPLADTDGFYDRIFAVTGRPRSVLDLACGINPIYLGARGVETFGVDISGSAVEAVNRFHALCGAHVSAVCADLLCPGAIPQERFDVALLFKLLPLLERQRNGAAMAVMGAVHAEALVVSFPTRTLSGRNVGMASQYSDWMTAHIPRRRAIVGQFESINELFFILK